MLRASSGDLMDASGWAQRGRRAGWVLAGKKYLIIDRDMKYSQRFRHFLEEGSTKVITSGCVPRTGRKRQTIAAGISTLQRAVDEAARLGMRLCIGV
jgi:hypothetical protein